MHLTYVKDFIQKTVYLGNIWKKILSEKQDALWILSIQLNNLEDLHISQ